LRVEEFGIDHDYIWRLGKQGFRDAVGGSRGSGFRVDGFGLRGSGLTTTISGLPAPGANACCRV